MNFSVIGIISKIDNLDIKNTINDLIYFLQDKTQLILVEKNINLNLKGKFEKTELKQLGEKSDLIIVIGGDGSFISASRKLVDFQKPILGINRGKLGFLTDIHPEDFSKIKQILEGNFFIEERFLLKINMNKNKKQLALNDIILHPGKWTEMVEFELFIDNVFVSNQKADGLIISTPTGSTAYALSTGGPILNPNLDAILINPLYPHTLSSRPIVINSQSKIQIQISTNQSTQPYLSFDGHNNLECFPNEIIEITKYPKKLKMIHHNNYNYYDLCRNKLNWGKNLIGDDENV